MGETWHCPKYTNSHVSWKPYLEGQFRYRYPGQTNWTIINPIYGGNFTYTTYQPPPPYYGGQNQISYKAHYGRANISGGTLVGWTDFYGNSPAGGIGPLTDVKLLVAGLQDADYEHWFFQGSNRNRNYKITAKNYLGQTITFLDTTVSGIKFYGFVVASTNQQDGTYPPTDCTFTVFEDGIQRTQLVNSTCPEVEIEPCYLSSNLYGETITKSGNQLILITDREYFVDENGYVLFNYLPPNELYIYKVTPKASVDDNNVYEFINKMESPCPDKRPLYQVFCSGEDCPDGTCKVECGSHYCCYNSEGISVKTIAK